MDLASKPRVFLIIFMRGREEGGVIQKGELIFDSLTRRNQKAQSEIEKTLFSFGLSNTKTKKPSQLPTIGI